ncbi:outer membrane lipoprotein-sorting protein [Aliikangiella sp. IMCC44359]|uniref:outer membrane lipoprotein-sorting protein n=1 Tax=Aliikangiella sp. IMCC44359 TaxID=3459125 RepID=UPI00403ADE73
MKFKIVLLLIIYCSSLLVTSEKLLADNDKLVNVSKINSASASENKYTAEEVFDKSVVVGLMPSWEAEAELNINKGNRKKYRRGSAMNLKRENERGSLRLFRFVEPVDVSGVSFLIHENGADSDDIWMYLPSLSKTRRILSSSKHDSFMGSDFSYADLMSARTEEYKHEFINDTECMPIDINESCFIVQSTVLSEDNVRSLGYQKLITYVSSQSFLPYRIRYFNKKNEELKKQNLSSFVQDIKTSTWIAQKRVMETIKKKSVSTLLLNTVKMGEEYEKRMFSMKRLGRR